MFIFFLQEVKTKKSRTFLFNRSMTKKNTGQGGGGRKIAKRWKLPRLKGIYLIFIMHIPQTTINAYIYDLKEDLFS